MRLTDSSGGRFVNNSKDGQTGDHTGILGSLSLSVVEVCGDGDDGVGNLVAEVGLSGLLHLAQDHGRDFLRGELLEFILVLDLDHGLSALVDDLERPVKQRSVSEGKRYSSRVTYQWVMSFWTSDSEN
jgi:hypothetical protein